MINTLINWNLPGLQPLIGTEGVPNDAEFFIAMLVLYSILTIIGLAGAVVSAATPLIA